VASDPTTTEEQFRKALTGRRCEANTYIPLASLTIIIEPTVDLRVLLPDCMWNMTIDLKSIVEKAIRIGYFREIMSSAGFSTVRVHGTTVGRLVYVSTAPNVLPRLAFTVKLDICNKVIMGAEIIPRSIEYTSPSVPYLSSILKK